MHPALAGRGQAAQLRQRPCTPLLCQTDQVHEHLGRCLGVRQGSVARLRRNAEEVGQRGEADAAEPSFEQTTRERGGAERRLGQAPVA